MSQSFTPQAAKVTWPCGCTQDPLAPVSEYTHRCAAHTPPVEDDSQRMTLVEFLLARIAEDDETARRAPVAPWTVDPDGCCVRHSGHDAARDVAEMSDAAEHIARWDPARVLAECEAKRRIIELADEATGLDMQVDSEFRVAIRDETAQPYVGDSILRALALPYAVHPDYREEWRP